MKKAFVLVATIEKGLYIIGGWFVRCNSKTIRDRMER